MEPLKSTAGMDLQWLGLSISCNADLCLSFQPMKFEGSFKEKEAGADFCFIYLILILQAEIRLFGRSGLQVGVYYEGIEHFQARFCTYLVDR
jgi:hypothetical protein